MAPLRDRATLRAVRRDGVRGRSGPVTVRRTDMAPDGRCRVAFAIGRSVGPAVRRNRIRRRLRAALVELAAAGRVGPGSVVISAGPSAADAPFPHLRSDLARALAAAGGSR